LSQRAKQAARGDSCTDRPRPVRARRMAAGLVISASELDRIRQTVGAPSSTSTFQTQAQRQQALHAKSQARARSWSNTLEGSRRKKAEEKRARLEAEELDKQRIDAEEAKHQLEQRRATVERANKLLHDESDRMKSFHSKMMLCDVLAEREAQVALKGELTKLEHIREDRFLEMEKHNYRKMLEREMKEKDAKDELSRITSKAQKRQLACFKDKCFKEVEDSMLEGELLRKKALEDLIAERDAERGRRAQAIKALQETEQANDYLKQVKAQELVRSQHEDEKIQEYAMRKEKMLQLRKRKEDEVFQQKQQGRNAMVEAQAKRLAAMQDREAERVEQQVQEKEANHERKRREKAEMKARWEADVLKNRADQIERKQRQRAREKTEDIETAKFIGEWCKVLDRQEQEEMELKNSANRKLAEGHLRAVEVQRRRRNDDKGGDKGTAEHARKALEADTEEFHAYAEKCIRTYAEEGKNVIPLIKELREFRKRVLE